MPYGKPTPKISDVRRGLTIILIFGGVASAATVRSYGQCEYDVTIIQAPDCLPFGSQPTFGTGVNSAGELAGYYCVCLCESDQAFGWTAEAGLVELAMPPGAISSRASGINDMGWSVGNFCVPGDGFGDLGFLHDGVKVISLGTLPGGTFSKPQAINIAGQVVGYWGNNVKGDPAKAAFLWHDGVMTDLSPELRTPNSSAFDINEAGQIVGWMGDSQFTAHAFIWEDGLVTDLGVIPGGLTGEGRAINSLGQVAGQGLIESPEDASLVLHAVLWNDTEAIDMGTLPGTTFSRALDLNGQAEVVGYCNNPLLTDLTAFVWQTGVMTDLNELIPSDVGITMKVASAINNAGQITGWASTSAGSVVAVLLTPIEPPVGDLDGDCHVGINDFLMLLAAWGPCPDPCPPSCPADLDCDGDVGINDFLILLAGWGPSP